MTALKHETYSFVWKRITFFIQRQTETFIDAAV